MSAIILDLLFNVYIAQKRTITILLDAYIPFLVVHCFDLTSCRTFIDNFSSLFTEPHWGTPNIEVTWLHWTILLTSLDDDALCSSHRLSNMLRLQLKKLLNIKSPSTRHTHINQKNVVWLNDMIHKYHFCHLFTLHHLHF